MKKTLWFVAEFKNHKDFKDIEKDDIFYYWNDYRVDYACDWLNCDGFESDNAESILADYADYIKQAEQRNKNEK